MGLTGRGGVVRQEQNAGSDQSVGGSHEGFYTSVKPAEISPLRSGLMVNEDSGGGVTSRQSVFHGNALSGLNRGFPEGYYSGSSLHQPQAYFRTNNIPVANEVVHAGQCVPMGGYSMSSVHAGMLPQQSENTHFVANSATGTQMRLNIPSNSANSISTTPSNGLSELPNQTKGSGYDMNDGAFGGGYQRPFQTQNLVRDVTGGGGSSNPAVSMTQSKNFQENFSLNAHPSVQTGGYGGGGSSLPEKPLPTSRAGEEFRQYDHYSGMGTRSFLSQQNPGFHASYQGGVQPFFSTNSSSQGQMNCMMSPQYLNSVPLLAQVRIESIQDLPNSIHHHHSIGIYNSATTMDYSIVASFNSVDDKNETYRIGPFPSSSISDSKLSCIVQDEISLPFSWSQPTLRLKILEENDFRADIIGVCSINIDMNSVGIPSQACLIDPQTSQVKGTLRFVVKLAPNQQNPNYRFDQIHGPNSILNRRHSQESSILNVFKGFCCAD
ncbi:hypothetical protein OIY81_2327 [Cryptosporidium canis]|nr:hypothetical protein OIY81_2327 [Cryptosporidium canis]